MQRAGGTNALECGDVLAPGWRAVVARSRDVILAFVCTLQHFLKVQTKQDAVLLLLLLLLSLIIPCYLPMLRNFLR